METVEAPPKRPKIPKWLLPTLGYTISAVSLVWIFLKFPYRELADHVRTLDWTWVALAIAFELAVYFMDAWRWAVLLRPVGAPSFGCSLQAVFVGLFANDVLPARAGEIVRCFLHSYKTKVPFSIALTSDLITRIMDGVWLVIIYLLITFEISSHVVVSRVMWVFGIAVIAV